MSLREEIMGITVFALGGTIGSKVCCDNIIRLGDTSSLFDEDVNVVSPFTYSSEDADIYTYQRALRSIYEYCTGHKPSGIVILHGTDTMAYFAQVAYRVLRLLDIPVAITGSLLPPDVEGSDAKANVAAAMEYVRSGVAGVVVTGKGIDGYVPAYKLMQASPDGSYGIYEGAVCPSVSYSILTRETFSEIVVVSDVPGSKKLLASVPSGSIVLIRAFHSGTCPSDITDYLPSGVRAYIAPIYSSDVVYESSSKVLANGVKPLYNMPFEGAWAEVMVNE
ncbi:MAG: asparaginase domain-containing protein [Saccharofermentans sp.]|nr:asparaginase domain-containing protein [Saccharofermentans sp.]